MDGFSEYLSSLGLADRTIATYCRELATALRWCEEHGEDLDEISAVATAAYTATRPDSWSTRKAVRTTLTHYWSMTERDRPPIRAVRVPPKPRGHCRAHEEDDTRILAKAARARGDDPGLAVALGLYCALRRVEIAKVRWENFHDVDQLTIRGKGGVEATIPVHQVVRDLLEAKGWRKEGWVFPGRFDRGVNPATIWTWTLRVAEEAGVDEAGPHRLRHSCLATANDNTHDLRSVQELARHSRPETTTLYTRTTKRRLRAVVASLDY